MCCGFVSIWTALWCIIEEAAHLILSPLQLMSCTQRLLCCMPCRLQPAACERARFLTPGKARPISWRVLSTRSNCVVALFVLMSGRFLFGGVLYSMCVHGHTCGAIGFCVHTSGQVAAWCSRRMFAAVTSSCSMFAHQTVIHRGSVQGFGTVDSSSFTPGTVQQ